MNNLRKDEKLLKRYLKTKVNLNESTIIKYLITGIIGFTLTACGGGGGGSSSSSGGETSGDMTIDKNMESSDANSTLVTINNVNGEIKENVILEIKGDNSVGAHIKGATRSKKSLVNKGKIMISGDNSIGILAEGNVQGINNGIISGISSVKDIEDTKIEKEEFGDNIYLEKYTTFQQYAKVIGMKSINGSTVVNNGDLSIKGAGIGIFTENKSSGINNGIINGISGDQRYIIEEYYNENLLYKEEGVGKTYIAGMLAKNESNIENGKNGIINIFGEAEGMAAFGNSKAINNGSIELTAEKTKYNYENSTTNGSGYEYSEIIGMYGESSELTNNGSIILNNNGQGMYGEKLSKLVNNGYIEVTGKYNQENGENIGTSLAELSAMVIETNSTGINNGKILITGDTENEAVYVDETSSFTNNGSIKSECEGRHSTGITVGESFGDEIVGEGLIVNNGSIIVKTIGGNATGISVYSNNSEIINSKTGKIYMESKNETRGSRGISSRGNGLVKNDGLISGKGSELLGIESKNAINNGIIQLESIDNAEGINTLEYENSLSNEFVNNGEIIVDSNTYSKGIGLYNETQNSNDIVLREGKVINRGTIKITGNLNLAIGEATGINSYGFKSIIENKENSRIEILGNKSSGIVVSDKIEFDGCFSTINNSGLIVINGNESVGISMTSINLKNKGNILNTGKIEVEGNKSAIGIKAIGNDVINNGIINVKGNKNSYGIYIEKGVAKNNGTINVSGNGSIGMLAQNGGSVVNEANGIINVASDALTGMLADGVGSSATNNGTINMASGNINEQMIAQNGGVITNNGTIKTDGDLSIITNTNGSFVIGTNTDGSYGKLKGKNISLDGNIKVSANITKNSFKDEYTLQNVVDSEDLTLGDSFTFNSTSLLYDAVSKEDTWGNLDATLTRNDKVLSDFASENLSSVANIFGKYQNEESFKELDFDEKEVISSIDTESAKTINKSLNNLRPTIYSNLGRQISSISETFKDESLKNSMNLGLNTYNFAFLGKYEDVDSRNSIEGYDSKLSGFVGSMNLGENTFGNIGYGYTDIDYDKNSKGNIQNIHLGLNKFMNFENTNLEFSLSGEYNFHENTRGIKNRDLTRTAKSDFDSYGVRVSGKVSETYGENIYLKPFASLDLAYMKYDSFTESGAGSINVNMDSENYTSLLPKVGLTLGDKIGGLNIFANVEYSYDFGDMDKDQKFTYNSEKFRESGNGGPLPSDDLESGLTSVSVGAQYEINNFIVQTNIGKNFGKRENTFADLTLSYKF